MACPVSPPPALLPLPPAGTGLTSKQTGSHSHRGATTHCRTWPRVNRLLLMACASFRRSPSVSDAFCRSLPARSTRLSLLRRWTTPAPSSTVRDSTRHCISMWLRLEVSLRRVAAVWREAAPRASRRSTSSAAGGEGRQGGRGVVSRRRLHDTWDPWPGASSRLVAGLPIPIKYWHPPSSPRPAHPWPLGAR